MSAITYPIRPVVLVVEDELLLRMVAVDFLEDAGFAAIAAANADDTVAILERRKDIRIVFTDIDMPGSMDGLKLAACIRNRWPPIELILTSGKRRIDPSELPARGLYFPKPYRYADITRAMHDFIN